MIEKEKIFDNEKRLHIYNFIAENQPVTYNEIKSACNINDEELNWHTQKMIQHDLIRVEKRGHYLFYKLYGLKLPPKAYIKLNNIQRLILDFINKNPGVIQVVISEKLGIKQQNISYNLQKLIKNGLIRDIKKGIKKYYYPTKQ